MGLVAIPVSTWEIPFNVVGGGIDDTTVLLLEEREAGG